ncbi:MAG: phosphate acyltransferase PlsX [Oscillospiraceae bacterium]|nr:phosphate acyltransferase PlsX [Oscillospiraceae bacterium]
MKIIIDAYGGDNAPLEILKGTAQAISELDVTALVCGREAKLRALAEKEGIALSGMDFLEAPLAMPVEAEPTEILKSYSTSSMAAAFKALADGQGDAVVTAGSTGALCVGGTLIVKRIKGIKRPALAPIIPAAKGTYMLLDVGANVECRPEMLRQFAVMGAVYMERVMGVKNPRVGIVNIGTEENKGTALQIEAGKLLRDSRLNFIGNIEARELPLGGCDVAVTDGFTGNIVLKLTEGMGKAFSGELKAMLLSSAKTKIAALLLKNALGGFKAKMDYTEHGGAPLMGTAKPVIKAHGSSNAKAFKNAIRQAKLFCEQDVISEIGAAVSGQQ